MGGPLGVKERCQVIVPDHTSPVWRPPVTRRVADQHKSVALAAVRSVIGYVTGGL
jgi:hypothetical protein